ncbi:MAG: hypothetical protein Q9209_000397 [Squamulea sp. 1 TL-2023]
MRSHDPLPLRLLTHNVRYATSAPSEGEEYWDIRAPRLISELRFNTLYCPESFICLQEVLHQQLMDILGALNQNQEGEWDYVGVGRDDGHRLGEYSPIIYRPSVWAFESWETVWLSETPDRPSRGWDAACMRILTVCILQHRRSKERLVAMNTHLDHQGVKSRSEAAKIILRKIDEKTEKGQLPLFLAGDFNSQQEDDAYLTLTSESSPMKDLYAITPLKIRYGHDKTFTGFGDDEPTRIDFLFVNQKSHQWLASNYGVLENRFDDGIYISDHRAVVADVTFH